MVLWPNVNPVAEMVSLTLASRAFEANVATFRAARAMALKALELGR
jgi:flagellar basal-body rod protein FlgC